MYDTVLQNLIENKCFVNIAWADRGNNVGIILAVDDDYILIGHVTAAGLYDGYILRDINQLCSFTWECDYEQKLDFLYHSKKQYHISDLHCCGNLMETAFRFAQSKKYLVTIETGDSALTGFIDSWDEQSVILDIVTANGLARGHAVIVLNQIDVVAVDTDYEQDLKKVYIKHINEQV